MKFYLSSFKFGVDLGKKLKTMMPENNRIACIFNARDYTGSDPESIQKNRTQEADHLNRLGFQAEILDLKDYFYQEEKLREKLSTYSAVWVSGGNTFVLRQAMKLSGFDVIIKELALKDGFLYAGYSAGICILSETLHYLNIVDKPYNYPYPEMKETLWDGLGFFNYAILPHYDSEHPETEDITRSIVYCIENKILFKALRDGDVIIIE